ncbi:MAG: TatD family hydrolase [Planctomycetes bacterium]|nr:TatD family hydrolase [Planctomycetota bacterium]
MLVDTHAHVAFEAFEEDRQEVILRAHASGVGILVEVGIDEASSLAALRLARGHGPIFAAVGVHPHHAADWGPASREVLAGLASDPKVVALGEMGLDYYRDRAPREVQREAFRAQLELASELDLPAIVHTREAWEDCLEEVERLRGRVRGVFHCFSGDVAVAARCVELGFHCSFAGPVTYPPNHALRAAAAAVPDDRLLLETDCPYLAPQARRGRRNEPAFVVHTAEAVARARGGDLEALATSTSRNARALFRIAGD